MNNRLKFVALVVLMAILLSASILAPPARVPWNSIQGENAGVVFADDTSRLIVRKKFFLFIHGVFTADDTFSFKTIESALESKFPDAKFETFGYKGPNRDYGELQWLQGVDASSKIIKEFLAESDIQDRDVFIIGHSFGGVIASYFAGDTEESAWVRWRGGRLAGVATLDSPLKGFSDPGSCVSQWVAMGHNSVVGGLAGHLPDAIPEGIRESVAGGTLAMLSPPAVQVAIEGSEKLRALDAEHDGRLIRTFFTPSAFGSFGKLKGAQDLNPGDSAVLDQVSFAPNRVKMLNVSVREDCIVPPADASLPGAEPHVYSSDAARALANDPVAVHGTVFNDPATSDRLLHWVAENSKYEDTGIRLVLSGEHRVGSLIGVSVEANSKRYATYKLAVSCGKAENLHHTGQSLETTWATTGCQGGDQRVVVSVKPMDDAGWDRAIEADQSIVLAAGAIAGCTLPSEYVIGGRPFAAGLRAAGEAADGVLDRGGDALAQATAARAAYLKLDPSGLIHANASFVHSYTVAKVRAEKGWFHTDDWAAAVKSGKVGDAISALDGALGSTGCSGMQADLVTSPGASDPMPPTAGPASNSGSPQTSDDPFPTVTVVIGDVTVDDSEQDEDPPGTRPRSSRSNRTVKSSSGGGTTVATVASAPCNANAGASQGRPVDTRTYELGRPTGVFEFQYNTLTVPDRIEIFEGTSPVGSALWAFGKSSGNIGGTGQLIVERIRLSGRSSKVTVRVTANQQHDTAWSYFIGCAR